MKNILTRLNLPGFLLLAISLGFVPIAASAQESASGHGTLLVTNEDGKTVRRQFSFSARRSADGSVKGNAVLHNPAFEGANGNKYQLQISISCMNVIGNVAFFGGTTRRTNDPNLVGTVFFSVEDNGEPGRNADRISEVFFTSNNPDPQICEDFPSGFFPTFPIESGNISIRD
ncbi:MAG: hypothetical protein ACR2M8_05450 [Pyrinomonadaceae bacterium]